MPYTFATSGTTTLPDVSIAHSLVQMVVALVVIVASIWGLGKVLNRMRSGTSPARRRAAANGLAVISRQTLGKDLSIATVRWGEREVLVGIAGSTITFLNDARVEEGPAEPVDHADGATGRLGAPGARVASMSLAAPSGSRTLASLPATAMHDGAAPRRPVGVVPARQSRPGSLVDALRDATLRR